MAKCQNSFVYYKKKFSGVNISEDILHTTKEISPQVHTIKTKYIKTPRNINIQHSKKVKRTSSIKICH
jgi:hypothetical protein